MHNILIVEDDPISGEYLKKILLENGFAVCGIEDNAEDALSKIKQCHPDLVLIDVVLYGSKSGCELALDIRRFDNDLIIIFLSAHSDQSILDYALDVNAYCYLLKPYRDSEIITTVKMALQSHHSEVTTQQIHMQNNYSFQVNENHLFKNGTDTLLEGKLLDFIAILAKHKGYPVSYKQLSIELYGDESHINTLRSLVHRIKQKFPDLVLENVNKKGYILH